jgi:2-methylisocitrate lyase-like PEP mutase family enzyme
MMGPSCSSSKVEKDAIMRTTTRQKRADFRKLHTSGCFVLPNPWDVGTARMFQHLGFQALASTSAGFAWSTGRPDYGLVRGDVLAHLRELSAATDLPVNADFESGFGADLGELSESVRMAVETGVSGLSVEDRNLEGSANELYDIDRAVERVRAARSAIDRTGEDVVLVARTETLLVDPSTISSAIDKLVAFADAGADCLYAPGVREKGEIASIVRAVAPKPVNVVMMRPGLSLGELTDLGVRRVSIGGAIARVAWASIVSLMDGISKGSFDGLAGGTPGKELNDIFAKFGRSDS